MRPQNLLLFFPNHNAWLTSKNFCKKTVPGWVIGNNWRLSDNQWDIGSFLISQGNQNLALVDCSIRFLFEYFCQKICISTKAQCLLSFLYFGFYDTLPENLRQFFPVDQYLCALYAWNILQKDSWGSLFDLGSCPWQWLNFLDLICKTLYTFGI